MHRDIVMFDCDSTLSRIEGVDELARLAGVFDEVKVLTEQAMAGNLPLEQVFQRRLDLIQPKQLWVRQVGETYIEQMTAGAREAIKRLQQNGYQVGIISGGYLPAILPLAKELGIKRDWVYAVGLTFTDSGEYQRFEDSWELGQRGGKRKVWQHLIEQFSPKWSVMIGDGVTDMEAQDLLSVSIGFGGVQRREAVVRLADEYLEEASLQQLPEIIQSFRYGGAV